MQVNSVQSSPNFGMALRIKSPKETAQALKELPIAVIQEYQKAGEKIKGTKFYHIEVGPDLKPQVVSEKGAYWGPYKKDGTNSYIIANLSENDNLGINSVYGVSRLRGGDVAEDGLVHHNVWSSAGPVVDGREMFTINSMADVVAKLDEAAVAYAKSEAARKAAEEAAKAKVSSAVDDLVSKFGVNA